MPTIKKFVGTSALILMLGAGLFSATVPGAAAQTDPFGVEDARGIDVGKETNLKFAIANVVNIALGFLGILAVIIIMYAGFKWMTASGNEEQVTDARKMLIQAVIGLFIIMGAWVIINFVVEGAGRAFTLE